MPEKSPPTIDAVAAARWHALACAPSPWLHEEVARRMQQRLSWIVEPPLAVVRLGSAARGAGEGHALVAAGLPKAVQCICETSGASAQATVKVQLRRPWWHASRWIGPPQRFDAAPAPASMQMVWANMALHMSAQPQALIGQWPGALAADGFLMFSCLGPDTLRELRGVYGALGWSQPSHSFTDMHDWGDMLAAAGFAEPVMDMERIILTFTPARLLQELRAGAQPASRPLPALRGGLEIDAGGDPCQAVGRLRQCGAAGPDFEVIYGHAYKPAPSARQERRSWTKTKTELRAQSASSGEREGFSGD